MRERQEKKDRTRYINVPPPGRRPAARRGLKRGAVPALQAGMSISTPLGKSHIIFVFYGKGLLSRVLFFWLSKAAIRRLLFFPGVTPPSAPRPQHYHAVKRLQ